MLTALIEDDLLASSGFIARWAAIVPIDRAPCGAPVAPPRGAATRQRILALADEILGERERKVYFARCMGDGEIMPLDAVAVQMGVSPGRAATLEASARRKMTTALAWREDVDFARGTIPAVTARRSPLAAE